MQRSGRSIIACPRMDVEPGSIVVAPLGPRQLLGVAWEPERLPTKEVGENRLDRSSGRSMCPDSRAAAAARRVDRGLLSLAASLGAADGPAVVGRARRAAAADRVPADGRHPRSPDSAAEKALAALEGRQGTIRELAEHAEVSDTVMRGLVNAGALEAVAVDADRPLPPRPRFAPPDLNDDQREAAASLRGGRQGFRPGPARRRHRVGQDRSLFRSDRRMPAPGTSRRSSCSPKSR